MRHAGLRLLSGLLLAAGLAQPLGAQLDSTCMVSALNNKERPLGFGQSVAIAAR
jgi:hypothetical protein